jgi:hypothetical protein
VELEEASKLPLEALLLAARRGHSILSPKSNTTAALAVAIMSPKKMEP